MIEKRMIGNGNAKPMDKPFQGDEPMYRFLTQGLAIGLN
jgi:hypothetical protein